jgi:lysozyme
MANVQQSTAGAQDPALAFLDRLLARLQSDQVFCSELDDCVSRGDTNGFFALLEQSDLDPDGAWDLDDDWLEEVAGGRGGLPLALALLAGSLGTGHGLQALQLAPPALTTNPGQPAAWQQHAVPLIRHFEGLALEAYVDPVGVVTIGYGTTRYPDGRAVQLGDRISAEQADDLLAHSLTVQYAPEMLEAIPPARFYSPRQQAALISFTYNVGSGALRSSSLRRRLLAGEDPQQVIAEELPRWCRGGDRELPGLVRRRAAEVALFRAGRYG